MDPLYISEMSLGENIFIFGIGVFVLIWIVFVPIAITSRLEKIIKLLEEKR
ncbi:MAG: hypothetical protein K8S27_09435 [Candidatus Omnitrophica bacterium]|nr:hypothetical protein [Candidatus Omnitrophota bacterium]